MDLNDDDYEGSLNVLHEILMTNIYEYFKCHKTNSFKNVLTGY